MYCFNRQELGRFLAGQLSPAAANAVAGHVEHCAACQAVLEELAGLGPLVLAAACACCGSPDRAVLVA